MKKKNVYAVLLVIAVLLLASLACSGSSNEGTIVQPTAPPAENQTEGQEAVSPSEQQQAAEPTESQDDAAGAKSFEVFKVGDTVQVDGHTIRMNSVEYAGSILKAGFTLINTGDDDTNLSELSFSAKAADGTKLDIDIFDCGSSVSGKVLPGDVLTGFICWSGASADAGNKIYYEANLFANGAVVFDASAGDAGPADLSGVSAPKTTIYKVGDIIKVQDHTIIMNSAEAQGSSLKANFTIENGGSDDLAVSSIMSFSARSADGTKLEQDIFDCGSGLDGSVLPGDKLKGNICWKGAAAGARIYYEGSLFGSGAIVWQVQ